MHKTLLKASPTPSDCSDVAKQLYRDAPMMPRVMMGYRPYICPFERLIEMVPTGSRVLDVGCGGGLLLTLLASAGRLKNGLGFDTSQPMIQIAQAAADRLDSTITFEQRSVEEGIPRGLFDVICLIDVMHHIPPRSQDAFLEELMQAVPPGGRFIYKDMCRQPTWRAQANRLHDLVLARQWVHYYPIARVESMASKNSLVNYQRVDISRLWYGHELRVYDRPD